MQLNPTQKERDAAAKLWAEKGWDECKAALEARIGEVSAIHDQLSAAYNWKAVTKLSGTDTDKRNSFRLMNADLAALRDRCREIVNLKSNQQELDHAAEIEARNGGSRPPSEAARAAIRQMQEIPPTELRRHHNTAFLRQAAEQKGLEIGSTDLGGSRNHKPGMGRNSLTWQIAERKNGVDELSISLDHLIGPQMVMTSGTPGALGGGSQIGADGGFSIYPPMTGLTVPLLFPPLVMDVVRRETTYSNLFVYRSQTSGYQLEYADADNAATKNQKSGFRGENEAGQEIKPKWETQRSPVVKCIAYAEVTQEQIDDGEDVDSLIADQLRMELRNSVDRDLLNGPGGTTDRMLGLLDSVGTEAMGAGTANKPLFGYDFISKAANQIITDTWLMPDCVVMSPMAWNSLSTARDNDGRLQMLDPQEVMQKQINGLPVKLSPHVGATVATRDSTVAIGAFSTAGMLVDRQDVMLSRTDSHDANYTKDVITIKATVRVASARLYDKAFRTVTAFGGRKAA